MAAALLARYLYRLVQSWLALVVSSLEAQLSAVAMWTSDAAVLLLAVAGSTDSLLQAAWSSFLA